MLFMIIVDGVAFHISTWVVRLGAADAGPGTGFSDAWDVTEGLQITAICVQESAISSLYLYATVRFLRILKMDETRKMIWQLLAINLLSMALDVGLLVVAYLDLTDYEQSFKGIVYSIKLKLEFAILGKLKKVVRHGSHVVEITDASLDVEGVGSTMQLVSEVVKALQR